MFVTWAFGRVVYRADSWGFRSGASPVQVPAAAVKIKIVIACALGKGAYIK